VHQEHYHTTEQPVQHREALPEQHHHTELPVESKSFDHTKDADLKRSLDTERQKYHDTQTRVEGQKTHSTEAAVAGEHVHHHVHETIQPVIHKETVEPHVVHKTVPIHEVHHNEAQHHSAHSLPPVSMEDFKQHGGSLKGREERQDFFPGEPKAFPGEHGATGQTTGMTGSHGVNPNQTSSSLNGGTTGMTTTTGTTTTTNTSGDYGASGKPGMLEKLNPNTDADRDGKAGVND